MLFTALLVALLILIQGDTTVADTAAQTPTGEATSWVGFALAYVITNVVPLVSAWVTKKYLNLRDTWYTRLSDLMKRVVYVAGTTAAMFIVQTIGLIWEPGMDVLTMENFISKLVLAAASTGLVALGIKTEQVRRGVAQKSASSHI